MPDIYDIYACARLNHSLISSRPVMRLVLWAEMRHNLIYWGLQDA